VRQFVRDDAFQFDQMEPAQQAGRDDQVGPPGVAPKGASVRDQIIENVQNGHGEAKGGTQPLGDVEQAWIVVFVGYPGADATERNPWTEAPHRVHQEGRGHDEGNHSRDDSDGHGQQRKEDERRDGGRPGAQSHDPTPVGRHLFWIDDGRAQAVLGVKRLWRRRWCERDGGLWLSLSTPWPLPAARPRAIPVAVPCATSTAAASAALAATATATATTVAASAATAAAARTLSPAATALSLALPLLLLLAALGRGTTRTTGTAGTGRPVPVPAPIAIPIAVRAASASASASDAAARPARGGSAAASALGRAS
jgi:hypothetical protein